MSAESDNRELLHGYLLGTLPEEERARIGQQALTDGEFFDRLREAEDDLIDALAHGELNAQDAGLIRRFLAETGQEDRLRMAQVWQKSSSRRPRQPILARLFLAIAATVVVLLAAGWLFHAGHSVAPAAAPVPRASGAILSIFLPAGVSRGARDVHIVSIPPAAGIVRIELETPPLAGASTWRAVLRDPTGAVVATQSGPIAGTPGNAGLLVPSASFIKSGEYEIELASSSNGETWTVLAYYYVTFR
jgi:hypothetical protein